MPKQIAAETYEARHPTDGPGWFTTVTAAVLWEIHGARLSSAPEPSCDRVPRCNDSGDHGYKNPADKPQRAT